MIKPTDRAANMLAEYAEVTWKTRALDYMPKGDRQDLVADLITDLLHYCRKHQLDPAARIEQAVGNFNAETKGEKI